MRTLLIALLLASVALASPRQQPKTIDSLRSSFLTAFNSGDAAALEKIFEPDVLLLSFTGQPVQGGATISKVMAGMSKQLSLEMESIQSRESGDLLYEAGTWKHLQKGTTTVRQSGTFIWVWKHEKDSWRIETMSVTAKERE